MMTAEYPSFSITLKIKRTGKSDGSIQLDNTRLFQAIKNRPEGRIFYCLS